MQATIEWTEAELKWLEEREERFVIHGIYSNPQIIPSYWQTFAITPDYKDAAEFEARVAKKLAGKIPLAMRMAQVKYNDFVMDAEIALKLARLDVEEDMEAEQCK